MKNFLKLLPCLALLLLLGACAPAHVKTGHKKDDPVVIYDFSPYENYAYSGDDLGCVYTATNCTFKLWAPTARNVTLLIYNTYYTDKELEYPMAKDGDGVWSLVLHGDLNGMYYLYQVLLQKGAGTSVQTVNDPYARGTSPNSGRTLIYDARSTDPAGWDKDGFVTLRRNVDAVLYELHLRDFTIHASSGLPQKLRGKYTGLVYKGGLSPQGEMTALDHLKELGVTHVHILPCYDYGVGDETQSNADYRWYDWGYDPFLYNNPEGSYATGPGGTVRQKEFKEMVRELHKNNIGVVFDAVFNHTFQTGTGKYSVFDKIFPGYYYREEKNGKYGNATGCGNEVASERPMARKFIIDSILYWISEYHVDGFRFDLMGDIDKETMVRAFHEAKKINPSVIFYGEAWDTEKILPRDKMMVQANVRGTGIAAFNDGIRDNLKGNVFNGRARGFIQGSVPSYGGLERLKLEIMGQSTGRGPDSIPVDDPDETVNYVSCHDNLCLWDRLLVSVTNASGLEMEAMDRLAAAVVLTSQGIPFLHAGDEFLRSKNKNDNSYNNNRPDVNPIDWSLKNAHRNVFDYYRGLIVLRKEHPAFRMFTKEMVDGHFDFSPAGGTNIIIYAITNHANGDPWKNILVALNGNTVPVKLNIRGDWNIVVNGVTAGVKTIEKTGGGMTVAPFSAMIAWNDGAWGWGKD